MRKRIRRTNKRNSKLDENFIPFLADFEGGTTAGAASTYDEENN